MYLKLDNLPMTKTNVISFTSVNSTREVFNQWLPYLEHNALSNAPSITSSGNGERILQLSQVLQYVYRYSQLVH